MPKFAIYYHLTSAEFTPQEQIDAESLQDAARIAGEKIAPEIGEATGVVLVPSGEELLAIPKRSVLYCNVRAVLDRRRAAANINFDLDETSLSAAPAGG